jgi:WD40 repeat protein
VRVWDTVTGEVINTLTGHSEHVSSVSFSPDGTCIVSGSGDNTVRLCGTQ